MVWVNQDDVARIAVGVANWAALSAAQQLDLEIIIADVEAAVNQFLGDRLGRRVRREVIRQVATPSYGHVIPVAPHFQKRNRIYLRFTPVYQGTITVRHGQDLNQPLIYNTDFVVDDMITGVSRQGCLFRKDFWPDPLQVQYEGGFDPVATPEEWKLINNALLLAIRSVYLGQTSNVTSTGLVTSGTIKKESIGKYSYEVDTASTSSSGVSSSDNTGTSDGMLPAAVVARLSRLNKPAMFV